VSDYALSRLDEILSATGPPATLSECEDMARVFGLSLRDFFGEELLADEEIAARALGCSVEELRRALE